jgi:hypothetical protein
MRFIRALLITIAVGVVGCVAEPEVQEISSASTISNAWDAGIGADGRHYFAVIGDFFAPSPGYSHRSHVACNGKFFPSNIYPGWVPGADTQMNVSIPSYPNETPTLGAGSTGVVTTTRCWISIELSRTSDRANAVHSNSFGPMTFIKIASVTPLAQQAGRERIRLNGTFPGSSSSYNPAVECNGAVVAASSIDAWTSTQVRISFPIQTSAASCALRVTSLVQLGSGQAVLAKSNAWPVRVGPATPAFPTTIGAYFWGGHHAPTSLSSLASGIQALRDAGMTNVVRLVMSPRLRAAGGNNTRGRVATSPTGQPIATDFSSDNAYGLDLRTFCPTSQTLPFLECAVRSPEFQAAFDAYEGSSSTIVLTVSDAASFGAIGEWPRNMDPTFLAVPANADAVRNEYRAMALALYETQENSGTTFVIDDWETDSQIYLGHVYDYALSRQSAVPSCVPCVVKELACEADSTSTLHCLDPELTAAKISSRVGALRTWFKLRQQGIALARADAESLDYTGVTVTDGVEIASTQLLMNLPEPDLNTLEDILPFIADSSISPATTAPGYVSYSAWDSTGRGTVDEDLALVKSKLALLSPVPEFALGELGVNDMTAHPWRFREIVKAAYRSGASAIIVWEAFQTQSWTWTNDCDQSGAPPGTCLEKTNPQDSALFPDTAPFPTPPPLAHAGDGLLTVEGAENALTSAFRSEMIAYQATGVLPPAAIQIAAMSDYGVSAGKHTFDVWGIVPSGTASAIVKCEGLSWPATLVAAGDHYNLFINDPGPGNCGADGRRLGIWCTFAIQRGSQTSPIFGPRRLCQQAGNPGKDWAGDCTQTCP